MSRFIFFAHDPGGAMMLAAAAPRVRARGHDIRFIGAGPAVTLWRGAGHSVFVEAAGNEASLDGVDAIVTGTGFSDRERDVWRRARAAGAPALAVIDAGVNLARRFESEEGYVTPDAVGVLDEKSRLELAAHPWWRCETHVIGQAHLQVQTMRLAAARDAGGAAGGSLVFFSEPVLEDYGDRRGFDQFGVFRKFSALTNAFGGLEVLIKPHPREDADRWRELARGPAKLTDAPAAELLVAADGVIGMTTMVLVEAHLLGVPVLSLQPARTSVLNPLVDETGPPVVDWSSLPAAWTEFLAKLGVDQPITHRFSELLRDADNRLADAMEAVVGLPGRK